MQALLDQGIASKRGVMCAHRTPAYADMPWTCGERSRTCTCAPGTCTRLAESERAEDRSIMLPLFHDMTEEQQATVIEHLQAPCRKSAARGDGR